ncbi:MAG TPA: Ig-like domain-containing protein [Candidatus Cybelea sp.]|nr:Ig-like domain-containing protein [Candidatus Cybelea sp.]
MRLLYSMLVAAAIVAVASCNGQTGPSKLAPVSAVPKPSLPPWIASISPTQSAQTLAQVRVIFAKPIAPLSALSGDGARSILAHVRVDPPLAGQFTLLTPRMIGFVADHALPIGTRVRITLGAGLRDLDGDSLPADLAWSFETEPLAFADLPQVQSGDDGSTAPPVDVRPTLDVTANAAVDVGSLAAHATLSGGDDSVPVSVALKATPTPYPGSGAQELFDPSLSAWVYELRPARELRKGTKYTLNIAPGVEPAYGNVSSSKTFSGSIKTYDTLAIVPTPVPSPDSGGRFAAGDPAIAFSNPIDPASVAGAVTISPAPASRKNLYSVADQSDTIAIDPYALDPNATYVATVASTVKDVFGQTLGSEQKVTIHTSDFAAGAWAPTGTSVLPAGVPVALNFYATNLPDNAYSAQYARMNPTQLLGNTDALSALPPWKAWPAATLKGARRNAQSVVRVPLQTRLRGGYGALAYGFRTGLDASDSSPSLSGIAQLTNLGVFSQWFPAHGIVLVQHLSDGAPVRGASVTVYRLADSGKVPPARCASGTTNAAGEADFAGVDVERCSALASSNQGPNLGVVVSEGSDVATVTTWNYSGYVRFDVYGSWTGGAPLSRGTIFSDRQMYQPGERAQLTGIAYYVKGDRVVPDANANYAVTLSDPSNATTKLGTRRTDAFGVFSIAAPFSNQQPLGYYSIAAKGTNGNEIDGSLRVAQFKPPNFNVTVKLGAASAAAGASVLADVSANYLFGAPLQGGTAHAYVTREVATLAPKGWDDFAFGPQWFYPEERPAFTSDVLQRNLSLDEKGNASLAVAVPSDLPFPMTYRVDMETTDVSNLSVGDSQSFLALPGDATIGLASDSVGKAGSAMPIRAIVTDAAGKPIPGRAVHLELQKMTYTSATQEEEGGENADQSIKYATVSTADVTSEEKAVTAQLTPSDVGPYRVTATFVQAPGDKQRAASATQIQVFAFGAGEADWGLQDANAVAIKLDKNQYAVGDTASALIASPYDRADVYVAVVRNDAIYRTTLHGVSGTVRFPFKVTQQMMPNAALQAVVVRRGGPLGTSPRQPTLSLTGMTAFSVDVSGRYLKLAIAPRNPSVRPASAQSVDFTLSNANGTPARGEIVAMVVNDAILQLSGYRLPDLVQTVFAQQPISTIFSDNRENVVVKTQTPAVEKGFGYGGGFLAGAAGTRVRASFQPMPYYGVLAVDAGGHAHATFTMPDDLTTWRVMAVALGSDASHFATGDKTFVSTQPLIANPLLPQFARPGDRFDLGVSIANQTGAGGALDLVLQLSGALAFAQGDPRTQKATESVQNGLQAFRFPVVVGTPVPSTLAVSGRLESHSDAFNVPFTASDRAVTDSAIDSGVGTGSASIPVDLRAGGSIQLTLANSIVPQFAVPSARQLQGEALPLADDSAARLVIAGALARLSKPYALKLNFDPAQAAAQNLRALLSYQRGDGGFGEVAAAKESDPFVTSAALDALLFARAHGVAVDGGAIVQASTFMAQTLANPGRFKWCSNALCKAQLRFEALWALGANGKPRTDFLSDIVAQSPNFDSATQIRLARYLLRAPGWESKGAAMADRLAQTLYVTGRYVTANLSNPWSELGSLVDAQSQMLQLLIERHAPPEQTDGAVKALVAQQCRCGWPTADDTASALTALSAYAATERLTPGTATATVNGHQIAHAVFGTTASAQTFTVQASSLNGGSAIVVTSSLNARVHYTLLYTYPVAPNAPGELAAFRVIRTVNDPTVGAAAATAVPLATMDLTTPAQPLNVPAGRVFDVGVRTIVDHPVDRLVIEDPLPAGFEAVDTSFRTTLQAIVPQSDSWQIDATQIYSDRVVAYAQHLDPGVYDIHYLVRSVTPGTFAWPGARAYLQNAPEQFGRSASTKLEVAQSK